MDEDEVAKAFMFIMSTPLDFDDEEQYLDAKKFLFTQLEIIAEAGNLTEQYNAGFKKMMSAIQSPEFHTFLKSSMNPS